MPQEPSPARENLPPLLRPLILFVVIAVAFIAFSGLAMALPGPIHIGLIAAQILVLLGGALLYRRRFAAPETVWPSMRSAGGTPIALVGVAMTAIVLGFFGNVIVVSLVEIFGLHELAEEYQAVMELILFGDSITLQILGALSVAVVAPLCEEVLFRGTLLPAQKRAGQTVFGIILLNGFLFALMHGSPLVFLSLGIIGAYLAHVTLKSGSLWPAIIGHAALNLMNGVILIRLPIETEDVTPTFLQLGVGFAVLGTLSAFLWWYSLRHLNQDS
jgi:uncharacterized protein